MARAPVKGGKGSPWANAKSRRTSSTGPKRDSAGAGKRGGSRSGNAHRKRTATMDPAGDAVTESGGRSGSRASAVKHQAEAPSHTVVDPQADAEVAPALSASVKLHKLLADAGLGSRRELERWIAAGRVEVNGARAKLGDRVDGSERIAVDGKLLGARARSTGSHPRVLMINKAEGVICTRRDPEGRKTVFADLPTLRGGRWISIGRLDVATTGLLLLCNDGELAHRMMHPSTGLDREYAVRIDTVLEDEQLARLKAGVESDGEVLRFADIRYFDGRGANHWYHVVLLEGRNHEVRRLFASVGAEVRRLKRVRYGPVLLPSWLRRGQRFELNNADVRALYETLGMEVALPAEKSVRRGDRRGLADRSVMIAYPPLPGVAAVEPAADTKRSAPASRKPASGGKRATAGSGKPTKGKSRPEGARKKPAGGKPAKGPWR